ncbi:flavin reductase family protein [Telmatospirillum sp. J64-1]|uniref:flavin reductase family protein n=1 Tax=Telmatospirillum sp. J64-1 TaxID=2502183 RepID=UPI00115EB731|nr:flavin reductase family protein [Telmatospirillum sp. J64-1]
MTVDPRSFRKALGCFPTGVTVVTTVSETGQPVGVTVSAFSSLSLEPPLVLFCLDKKNNSLEALRASGHFVINVLRDDQRELSIRFSSRMEEKWKGLSYDSWVTGSPVLPGCLANIECRTSEVIDGGDHAIFIGQVVRLESRPAGQPLVYFRGAYADIGCTAGLP